MVKTKIIHELGVIKEQKIQEVSGVGTVINTAPLKGLEGIVFSQRSSNLIVKHLNDSYEKGWDDALKAVKEKLNKLEKS